MGAVYLAHDAVRGEEVALKRIFAGEGTSRVRFKREFRGIERLAHANLIRVFELDEDEQGPFFTMEVVRGVDLAAWCAPGTSVEQADTVEQPSDAYAQTFAASPSSDERTGSARRSVAEPERVARALSQILEALAFLHANGVVHRDLKPSNVLVDFDEVVKLVDFGILGELGARDGDREVSGTAGYMAPEQVLGLSPRPENDFYALGVILFELYAGRLPFEGTALEVMRATVEQAPPSLRTLVDVPEHIARVIDGLLAKDPAARPDIAEIARAFPEARDIQAPIASTSGAVVEGRVEERETLAAILDDVRTGSFRVAAIVGPSGAGKSTLARWLDDRANDAGMSSLHGRGRPNERVAFNAVDGLVDGLALWLSRRELPADDPAHDLARRASAAFPALAVQRRVPPSLARHQAFDATVALISRMAQDGLLLVVDDLQWADEDSLAFLQHLFHAAPRSVLLLATLRDDVAAADAHALIESADARVLTLGPLDTKALRAIAVAAIERCGQPATEEMIARVVDASDGRPFLAELAARLLTGGASAVARSLPDAVAALLADVDEERRNLLAALVARDGAANVEELANVVERSPGAVDDALRSLEREGLVRRVRARDLLPPADLYHDAVRLGVASALGEEAIVRAHARYADVLPATISAVRRVRHMLGAGRVGAAAILAVEGAHEASSQRAFGLAAEMWSVALRSPDVDRFGALRARADALLQIGRYRDAAVDFHALAEEATGEVALDAAIRETHALLAAHEIRAGRARAAAISGASFTALLAALISAIGFLIGPIRAVRALGRGAGTARAAVDRDVQLGMLLTYFDPISGLHRLRRARARAVEVSAGEHAAWCDDVFAYYAYFGQSHRGPCSLAERYRARALAELGSDPPGEPALLAFPSFLDGIAHKREGRWTEAAACLDRAAAAIEDAGQLGTFEHMMVLVHRCQVDWYAQDLSAMASSLARFRIAARQAEDSALRCHLDYLEVSYALFRGEFEDAAEHAQRVRKQWPDDIPTLQRFVLDLGLALVDVFAGDPRVARRSVALAMRRDARFRPMSSMYAGQFATVGALVEAEALVRGDAEASARNVHAYARRAEHAPPFGTAAAGRAVGRVWSAKGRPDLALAAFVRSEARAREHGQRIDLALAGHARGLLLGGDEGRALCADARTALIDAGASIRLIEST